MGTRGLLQSRLLQPSRRPRTPGQRTEDRGLRTLAGRTWGLGLFFCFFQDCTAELFLDVKWYSWHGDAGRQQPIRARVSGLLLRGSRLVLSPYPRLNSEEGKLGPAEMVSDQQTSLCCSLSLFFFLLFPLNLYFSRQLTHRSVKQHQQLLLGYGRVLVLGRQSWRRFSSL